MVLHGSVSSLKCESKTFCLVWLSSQDTVSSFIVLFVRGWWIAITKQVNCDTLEMNVRRSNAHLKLHALLCRLQVVGGESYKIDGLVKIVPVHCNAHQKESWVNLDAPSFHGVLVIFAFSSIKEEKSEWKYLNVKFAGKKEIHCSFLAVFYSH